MYLKIKEKVLACQIALKTYKLSNLGRVNKIYLVDLLNSHIVKYPTPISLTYSWSFGSLAGVSLVIQIVSGLCLAMFYAPHMDLAFASIEYIMRDIPNGWLIRYTHANGASLFFMTMYGHICRGIYYGSYMKPREFLWCSGVVLFLLVMATAFTGYVLPWGQMSFWGATVITSMVTALPVVGKSVVEWIWGGHVILNPTLKRFYVVHVTLPFIVAGITFIHLALLHKVGSNNPIGSDTKVDDIPFYPYFFSKDLFAFSCYTFVFVYFVLYFPNFLNHPDNCVPADRIETPPHVVPEWYFLAYFAILRGIPYKATGIMAMLGSILILLTIPFTNGSWVRNTHFRPFFKPFFWTLIGTFWVLTWAGTGDSLLKTYSSAGGVLTAVYFMLFLFFPIIGKLEYILLKTREKK